MTSRVANTPKKHRRQHTNPASDATLSIITRPAIRKMNLSKYSTSSRTGKVTFFLGTPSLPVSQSLVRLGSAVCSSMSTSFVTKTSCSKLFEVCANSSPSGCVSCSAVVSLSNAGVFSLSTPFLVSLGLLCSENLTGESFRSPGLATS
ncbi:unnamed protein product [Ixodes pacificus]